MSNPLSSSLKKIKETYMKEYGRFPLMTVFITGMVATVLFCVIMNIFTHGLSSYFAMFPDKNDIFMDYFNSIFYSLNDPYTEYKVIYPPLITAIYELIGHWITIDPPLDGFDIRASYTGMFSYVLLTMVAVFVMHSLLRRNRDSKVDVRNEILILLLIFSYPMLFTVMRGNCIVYSLIFTILFLYGYRSESPTVRCLSYISLGIAAGLKMYPALFGLLVIRERNVKDILA